MKNGKISKKQKIQQRIQLIDELIDSAERKLQSSFFVQQYDAIFQEIIRLNNIRKELAKQV